MPVTINGTSGITNVDGTAAAPALTGSDTDTGIFFPAANTLAFSTNGTEDARFDSSGNLGIGTSSPGQKLEVAGTTGNTLIKNTTTTGANGFNASSTGGNFYFGVDASDGGFYNTGTAYGRALYSNGAYPMVFFTNATERARLDSSGNLLVGTSTSPTGSSKVVFRQGGTSNPDSTWNASSWPFAVVAPEPALYLSSNIVAATGVGSATQTAKGGIGFRYVSAANPTELDIGIIGTSTVPGPVCFYNDTERARIDSSGNLGIGTSSPVAKQQIKGTGTSGQVTASWILENGSSGTAGMDITGSAGSSYLRFLYGGGPGTGTNTLTETMRIGLEGASAGVQQIKFAATQVASSDANTLDDYEEGTWTPNVFNNGSSSTWTVKIGRYTKVGNLVTCWFNCDGGNSGTAGGALLFTGLPFADIGNGNWQVLGMVTTNATASQPIMMQGTGGSTAQIWNNGGGQDVSQRTYISGMFTYRS